MGFFDCIALLSHKGYCGKAGRRLKIIYCNASGKLKLSGSMPLAPFLPEFPASKDEGCQFKTCHMPRSSPTSSKGVLESDDINSSYLMRPPSCKFTNNSFELNISSSPQTCLVSSVVFTEATSNSKTQNSNLGFQDKLGEQVSTINYT